MSGMFSLQLRAFEIKAVAKLTHSEMMRRQNRITAGPTLNAIIKLMFITSDPELEALC